MYLLNSVECEIWTVPGFVGNEHRERPHVETWPLLVRNTRTEVDKSSGKQSEVLIANFSRFPVRSLFFLYNFVTYSLKVPREAFILAP